MALGIKSFTQGAASNARNVTATIPPSPAPVVGDTVIVLVGINPGTGDGITGPAGWLEKNASFFGTGFAVGKVFARAWAAGVANPAFSWATRCTAGWKTVVVSGANGLPPNNVSVEVIPTPTPVPVPSVSGGDVTIIAPIDATNAVRVLCSWLPVAGSSRTGHGAHGHAG